MTMVEIRPAKPGDASELAELINEIIVVGGTTAKETPFTSEAFSKYFLQGDGHLSCFVAVNNQTGQLAGFQTLDRRPNLPDDCADIATFARLKPKLRGVGTALFAATLQKASELGFTTINATIRADNTGGLTFYDKMGFKDYDVIEAVPLADGTPVDRIRKRFQLG